MLYYAQLDMCEEAIFWLKQGGDKLIFLIVFVKADPVFDKLRDDKRFQEQMRRMGL